MAGSHCSRVSTERDAASRLTGQMVLVEREQLPPAQGREHYRDDLVGFEARNLEGALLGVVDHFIDTPGNAVMVIKGVREHLVPVTTQHLQQRRQDARNLVVDWPEDFLTRPMRIEVVTLFPELIQSALKVGVLGRAIERGHRAGRVRRSTRAYARCASHGRRPAVRRRAGHGAQARADVRGDRRGERASAGGAAGVPERAGRSPSRRRWRRNFRRCRAWSWWRGDTKDSTSGSSNRGWIEKCRSVTTCCREESFPRCA